MVVGVGTGWTVGDLSDSLRDRTAVPAHLFYLVVEGLVLGSDELVGNLSRDRVFSMRGKVLGGSRNVTPIPGEWTCPGCSRSGCWPTKSTCFRCGTARPNTPFSPGPVLSNSRPGRAPREQRHPRRVPAAGGCYTERRSPLLPLPPLLLRPPLLHTPHLRPPLVG